MTNRSIRDRSLAFDRWIFDPDTGDLTGADTSLRLEPQVAKLLAFFFHNQQRVLSRDELIRAVWDGREVSDDAINRCVSILRNILTPRAKQAYVETVLRKGYLAHFPPPKASTAPAEPARGSKRRRLLVLAVAVAAALLLAVFSRDRGTPAEATDARQPLAKPTVAVLPFSSDGEGTDGRFFADGVHNDLLTQLAQLQSLRVISRTSVMEYRGALRNLRVIGEELGADAILEGSVQVVQDRIRINAQLIDVQTDEHLWAQAYDRELSSVNIFDVQMDIARAITIELHATVTAGDTGQLTSIPTRNMAAYRAYYRAMEIQDGTGREDPAYRQALREAVELDPEFASAWADLVVNTAFLSFHNSDPALIKEAEDALERLQAVAAGSTDHRIAQAAYLYYVLKDYDRAHDVVANALAQSPGNTRALDLKSWVERRRGDFDAFLESKRQLHQLDPRSAERFDSLLYTLVLLHRYDDALAEAGRWPLETQYSAYVRSLARVRSEGDFSAWRTWPDTLHKTYINPLYQWDAHLATRDYTRALELTDNDANPSDRAENATRRVFTLWLLNDQKALATQVRHGQRLLDADRNTRGEVFQHPESFIDAALLAAIEGNANDAHKFVEGFFDATAADRAVRAYSRHYACRVLGMIGATQETVACLRDAFAAPSNAIRFVEPYLPFYDGLRAQPGFARLMAEGQSGRADTH